MKQIGINSKVRFLDYGNTGNVVIGIVKKIDVVTGEVVVECNEGNAWTMNSSFLQIIE